MRLTIWILCGMVLFGMAISAYFKFARDRRAVENSWAWRESALVLEDIHAAIVEFQRQECRWISDITELPAWRRQSWERRQRAVYEIDQAAVRIHKPSEWMRWNRFIIRKVIPVDHEPSLVVIIEIPAVKHANQWINTITFNGEVRPFSKALMLRDSEEGRTLMGATLWPDRK
jgi:hypothetical protein